MCGMCSPLRPDAAVTAVVQREPGLRPEAVALTVRQLDLIQDEDLSVLHIAAGGRNNDFLSLLINEDKEGTSGIRSSSGCRLRAT